MAREVITPWKVQLTPMCSTSWRHLRHFVVPWHDGTRSKLVRYCPPTRPGLSRGWVFAEVLGLFVGRQREFHYDRPNPALKEVPF